MKSKEDSNWEGHTDTVKTFTWTTSIYHLEFQPPFLQLLFSLSWGRGDRNFGWLNLQLEWLICLFGPLGPLNIGPSFLDNQLFAEMNVFEDREQHLNAALKKEYSWIPSECSVNICVPYICVLPRSPPQFSVHTPVTIFSSSLRPSSV